MQSFLELSYNGFLLSFDAAGNSSATWVFTALRCRAKCGMCCRSLIRMCPAVELVICTKAAKRIIRLLHIFSGTKHHSEILVQSHGASCAVPV